MKNINALEALPFEEPEEVSTQEIEVVDEESIEITDTDVNTNDDNSDQPTLF